MGVRPWRELQPEFPNALLGAIMSSYFGGRAEVRLRREVRQVLLLRLPVDVPDRMHADGSLAVRDRKENSGGMTRQRRRPAFSMK